jgi:hypothetical protein
MLENLYNKKSNLSPNHYHVIFKNNRFIFPKYIVILTNKYDGESISKMLNNSHNLYHHFNYNHIFYLYDYQDETELFKTQFASLESYIIQLTIENNKLILYYYQKECLIYVKDINIKFSYKMEKITIDYHNTKRILIKYITLSKNNLVYGILNNIYTRPYDYINNIHNYTNDLYNLTEKNLNYYYAIKIQRYFRRSKLYLKNIIKPKINLELIGLPEKGNFQGGIIYQEGKSDYMKLTTNL